MNTLATSKFRRVEKGQDKDQNTIVQQGHSSMRTLTGTWTSLLFLDSGKDDMWKSTSDIFIYGDHSEKSLVGVTHRDRHDSYNVKYR